MTDNFFISVEGVDGSGKTTMVEELSFRMDESIYTTEEPFLDDYQNMIDDSLRYGTALETLFVLQADRAAHVQSIRESVEDVVITDRYIHSTIAYQTPQLEDEGFAYPYETAKMVVSPFPKPDVVIFADCDPETSLRRIKGDDNFEDLEFLERVYDIYKECLWNDYSGEVLTVDTTEEYDAGDIIDALYDYGLGT